MSNEQFYESLDDTIAEWRFFCLDKKDDGVWEIVCSDLLTRQASVRRAGECSDSRRPLVVSELLLDRYESLEPGAPVLARHFTSHSELGAIGMFWELLCDARRRRGESKRNKNGY